MTTPSRKKWLTENRERLNEASRVRYARDIEKYAAIRAAKRDKANAYAAEYRTKNKEKVSQSMDRYYLANKEKWKGYAARRKVREDAEPEYRAKLTASVRRSHLKRSYGIGLEEYEKMLAACNNLCEICQRPDFQALAVDHNHSTRAVRGLLCRSCNQGIGVFEDNPELLIAASKYLQRNT